MHPLDSGGKRKPCNLWALLFLASVLYWYNERTNRKFLGFCIRFLKGEENMFIVSLVKKKKGIILATLAKARTSPCFVFLECVMSPGIPLSHCSVVESNYKPPSAEYVVALTAAICVTLQNQHPPLSPSPRVVRLSETKIVSPRHASPNEITLCFLFLTQIQLDYLA